MADKVYIFDTTLRDGEQSPGASMTIAEKVEFALQLEKLKVDVIEAGFPISSQGDFDSVREVAEKVKGPIIAGLARAREADIVRCAEALKPAAKKRIHTFVATSDIHVEKKLRKSKEEVIDIAVNAVRTARKYTDDVEFSPEDASRTGKDYLCDVIEAVIDAGATSINIPDTVGYSNPWEFGNLIAYIRKNVSNIESILLSVHCHNDLGLAVANSLAAIRAGARQVECTINGLGERSGNAALEEIVMNLFVRPDVYNNVYTDIETTELFKSSRLLARLTGFDVPRNKAIVGDNSFAHESGIHQDGMLKERTTYEIMSPGDVGWIGTDMVLGKHSGRHAFKNRLKALGYTHLNEKEVEDAFRRFKVLADKKKEVFDDDIMVVIEDEVLTPEPIYALEYLHTISGSGTNLIPTATIKLRKKDETIEEASSGDGPVDAIYKAIEKIVGISGELKDYKISSVSRGKDALGEASIMVKIEEKVVHGRGTSTDIVEASAKAYLNAINKYLNTTYRKNSKSATGEV